MEVLTKTKRQPCPDTPNLPTTDDAIKILLQILLQNGLADGLPAIAEMILNAAIFSNVAHLSKAFHRLTGSRPSQFRRHQQGHTP